MRYVLLAVVVAALCVSAQAQTRTEFCDGFNVTTNIRDTAIHMCPFGYVADLNQGRCLTYRQLVNNFLYAPCNIDADCGPLATNPQLGTQIMACGTQKVCTWHKTRALGDSCSVNTNCAPYGSAVTGCSKYNNTCVFNTTVTTAGYLDRCNYQDYAEYVTCDPTRYYCSDAKNGTCLKRLDIGETCGRPFITNTCRTGTFCFNFTCTAPRNRGEQCTLSSECSQVDGTTICYNQTCFAQRNRGQDCASPLDCSQADGVTLCFDRVCSAQRNKDQSCYAPGFTFECSQTNGPLYCNGATRTCIPYQPIGENCNNTFTCGTENNCVDVTNTTTRICMAPAGNNQTCGIPPAKNRCQATFTCIRDYCSANGLNDPCTRGTCNGTDLVCANEVCAAKVGIGGNCSATSELCMNGLTCYNKTCIALQNVGQPCDPTGFINPLNPLFCNNTLQCSRGVCITPYSLNVGAFCAVDADCDSSYCDPLLKQCTRRRLCSRSDTSAANKCTCICNAGRENLGQCILDLCNRQKTKLETCLSGQLNTTVSITAANFAWLDSQSSFYSKCESQHQDYVLCQAKMSKVASPSIDLGDLINYNLAGVNSANTLTTSFVAMIAVVVSVVLML